MSDPHTPTPESPPLPPATSIAAAWERYRAMVLPVVASEVQVVETRKAFYAGAIMLFRTLISSLTPGKEATAADMAFLTAIDNEIVAFETELYARLETRHSSSPHSLS